MELALLQPSHAGLLFECQERNRSRLLPRIPNIESMRSVEDVCQFLRKGLERFGAERGILTGIFDRGMLAGMVTLRVHEDGYGTLGYWVDEKHLRRGLATKGCLTLSRYAFGTMELRRLEIRVEPSNYASIRVAERAGFVREGHLRGFAEVNGSVQDFVLFSRLSTDPDPSSAT